MSGACTKAGIYSGIACIGANTCIKSIFIGSTCIRGAGRKSACIRDVSAVKHSRI